MIGLYLTAPYLVYLVIVYAVPIIQGFRISVLDYVYAAPGASVPQPFVGLKNYRKALSDPLLRRSFLNILEFLAINVPLTVILGMTLAAVLAKLSRMKTFFRSAFFVPYVTASIAVIGVWYFLFSQGGLIDHVLGSWAPNPSWLVNSKLAMVVIALEVTWKQLGFYVLLYLAGVLLIPDSLYEAASIDGAGPVRQFRAITVPALRNITILVTTLALIVGANLFAEPYLLTGGGGPNGATMSPALLIYQKGVEQGEPGVGAAIGVLLTLFILLVAGAGAGARRLVQAREAA
ncbi:carbohydrate ABC transporter permease [Catenulispora pinisilvae]|uniref:carbohydrate ABC transporter permease n=1 Tax=Catenulispora pinisilvae TaxID=2705253 RepID=UPI0018922E5A|nr:sugar ABC transporter permease [Catenulispora pinisilvae]